MPERPMAEKRKISVVLADVDGTLVTEDKVLTKRAQNAVSALQRLRAICAEDGLHPVIEVGGGENVATAARAAAAGASAILAGAAIFGAKDYAAAIAEIRANATAAAARS
jgi:pentose-5-phosphate-3-epimerase